MSDEIPIGPGNPRGEYGGDREHMCKSFSQNQELKPRCAHCKVVLKHTDYPDGTRSDYWECADGCGTKFKIANTRATDQVERLQFENQELRRTFGSHPYFDEHKERISNLQSLNDNQRSQLEVLQQQLSTAQAKLAEMREVLKNCHYSDSQGYWLCASCHERVADHASVCELKLALDDTTPSTHIPIIALEPVVEMVSGIFFKFLSELDRDDTNAVRLTVGDLGVDLEYDMRKALALLTKLKDQQ